MWDYKQIRKRSFDSAFKKGRKSWIALVAVGLIFSIIGASNASQTTFMDAVDMYIMHSDSMIPEYIEILKEYILESETTTRFKFINDEIIFLAIDFAANKATWVLKLLAANLAYLNRNKGEVIVFLVLNGLVAVFVRYFILNVSIVGRNRFAMENRFERKVEIKRIFAPFHRDTFWNIFLVMSLYSLTITIASITVVGGIYFRFKYAAIPYLIAENPHIKWKDAKELSSKMTNGYKWKMFITSMTLIPFWLLLLVPVAGILVAVPMQMTYNAELYFALRNMGHVKSDKFVEHAFSYPPFTEKHREPKYTLENPSVIRPEILKDKEYCLQDYILMFFIFCFAGWLYECGLHIFRDHELVNRGTMYGPWIPIYGFGGTRIVLFLDRYKDDILKFTGLEILISAVLEYFTSFALDYMFNSSYWDYKTQILNINGRICFTALCAFALGGSLAVYIVRPLIAHHSAKMDRGKRNILCIALITCFAIDLICCAIFGFNTGAGVGGAI